MSPSAIIAEGLALLNYFHRVCGYLNASAAAVNLLFGVALVRHAVNFSFVEAGGEVAFKLLPAAQLVEGGGVQIHPDFTVSVVVKP